MTPAPEPSPNDLSTDIAPPRPSGPRLILRRVRESLSRILLPLMRRVAHAYVGGDTVEDAAMVACRFAADGLPSTLSYWNRLDSCPREVADEYLASIGTIVGGGLDSYLSIKSPALRYDCGLSIELAERAKPHGVRLHFDSHGPEVVAATSAMIDAMLERLPAQQVSTTLPGRWSRSLSDAEWAIDRGIPVRVVKGEWPDPADPTRDPHAGFLAVIDRLAGRAAHVAVASHNVRLAAESIRRLRGAGTPCELELLFGLPMGRSLDWAAANGVATRIYVPYGPSYIPHAINQLRRKPQIAWWIIKDVMSRAIGFGRSPGANSSGVDGRG